jgi:hypothetical protein
VDSSGALFISAWVEDVQGESVSRRPYELFGAASTRLSPTRQTGVVMLRSITYAQAAALCAGLSKIVYVKAR